MIPAEISISLHGSVILAVLLVLAGMAVAFGFYRFTMPPLPPRRRILLSILRGCSLSLILILLFEPIVRIVHRNEQPPRIAVLIDDSQSMGMTDKAGNRADQVRHWVGAKPLGSVSAEPEYYLFSSRTSKGFAAPPDSLSFAGQSTDMALGLSNVKAQLVRENIQGVVLVSDGQYTVGRNPLYDAQELGVPVFTVGVGDTAEQKDVVLEKIVTNAIAYAGSSLPIEATVKSSGYSGDRVEVTITDGTGVLDRQSVTLAEGTHEYPVRFHVQPAEEGVKKYVVAVTHLPGELTEKNNMRTVFVKVLKSKLQVLIIAGVPSADVTIVRQALVEDGHFAVRAFVQKSTGGIYEEKYSKAAIDSADCLVLIGYPATGVSPAMTTDLRAALDRLKKPLLFVPGRTTDYNALHQLESYLPFTWAGANPNEAQVFPIVDERHRLHPLITLEGNASPDVWQQLPPVWKSGTLFRPKPEADVLAGVMLQNVDLQEPLVAVRNINGQRSFGITAYNIWQWRLMAQGNTRTAQFLPLLLSNAVRWLTTKDDDRKVRIQPVKQAFTTAEPVEFTAQVYDDQLHPVDNAEVSAELRRGSEATQLLFRSAGNGMYEGVLEGMSEGDYAFTGKAMVNGVQMGTDAGKFSVGSVNVEYIETRMNKPLLEQIAYRTGGSFVPVNDAGSLAQDIAKAIHFAPKELVQADEIELWNWRYLLGIIVLLLAFEWVIRKLNGML